MSYLPQGWATLAISDVADLVRGVAYKKDQARGHGGEGYIPLLRATNISNGLVLDRELSFVPDSVVSAEQALRVGDIVLASSSGSRSVVGKSAMLGAPWFGTFGAFCAVLRATRIDARFLAHYVASPDVRRLWSNAAAGTNINNLKRGDILSTIVPVPPPPEQRRIVGRIDEQFSRLDAADASLARAERNLKRFHSAVIAAALAGEWPLIRFGDVVKSLRAGIFVSRPAKDPPGIPIFRISAVRPMHLDFEDVRYAPALPVDASSFVEPGDLLFTRYSGNPAFVGACAVVPDNARPTLHPDKLIRVVVDRERVLPGFVSLTLNNGESRKEIERCLKTTAGQVGISGRQLRSVLMSVPPLQLQRQILDDVSRKLSICNAEIKAVQVASQRSRQLRRGILEEAFTGRLTTRMANNIRAPGLTTTANTIPESGPRARGNAPLPAEPRLR